MKNTRFVDMVSGAVIMLVSAYWFFEANRMMKVEFGIGPGGYPKFASGGLFILGFILFFLNIIKGLPRPTDKIKKKELTRQIVYVAATIAYVWAMKYLGFLLLTPFFMYFSCWFFEYRKKRVAVIASIGVTAVLYVIFRLIFFVALPEFSLF